VIFLEILNSPVKQARGQMAAECLPLAMTIQMIEDAAKRAVQRLGEKRAPAPFTVNAPIRMVIEFAQSVMADNAMIMPGAERLEDRKWGTQRAIC
jgi:D-aminopeptidase